MENLRYTEIINEAGEPLVVSHWTNGDFDAFDESFLGQNTDDNASDENFAQTSHIGFFFNVGADDSLSSICSKKIDAYLNIENPCHLDSIQCLALMIEYYGSAADCKQALIDDGYDGLIIDYDEEFGGTDYIPFSTEQIIIK